MSLCPSLRRWELRVSRVLRLRDRTLPWRVWKPLLLRADWPQWSRQEKGQSLVVPLNQMGESPRIYVKTGQWVESTLSFPQGEAGEKLRVEMLDGGVLESKNAGQLLTLGADLRVRVRAQISGNEGIHRVRVTRGTESYVLNYWAGAENIYAGNE
ncbi:MAG: hypothetical protein HC904_17060 [Blastochloris sp.]|nr:hypothetical protein [Blastochloris sp.]